MPVLQVPAREKGGPGGLPNLLKEEEKEEDEEEKKEYDDGEEEMKGKRKDEEDMQESLVVEEGMMLKFPLVPFVYFSCSSCFKVLSTKRKLKNHIVEIHKDPTS